MMIKPKCRYCGVRVKNFGDVCIDDQEREYRDLPPDEQAVYDEAIRSGATHRDAMEAVTY